jgi:hypothetical protein
MIHTYKINELEVKTGDLICTTDGNGNFLSGQIWRLIGRLIPGEVDHIAVYIGPGGRCVEAGGKLRVITFDVEEGNWNAQRMTDQRGPIIDTLCGIAYPLKGLNNSEDEINGFRERIAEYCLAQADANKPYNINFFDSQTEEAFYCSQLAYKAYLKEGIDLNSGKNIINIPWTESIVFPQEIWENCEHKRAG